MRELACLMTYFDAQRDLSGGEKKTPTFLIGLTVEELSFQLHRHLIQL